jgi:hypothetical protein
METQKERDATHNRRTGRRRVLRQPGTLTLLPGRQSRAIIVWDLGLDGMSVMSPKPVPPGTRCELQFDLVMGGQATPLHAEGKTVYSSFVGADGFRVGLIFTRLPDDAMAAVERFADAGA